MTNGGQSKPNGERLRQEAANWWAAMHGPMADTRRKDFEAWLDTHSDHRGAYNRMGEIHALGKHLKDEPSLASMGTSLSPRRAARKYVVPATIVAAALLVGSWTYRQVPFPRLLPPVQDDTGSMVPFQRVATRTLSTGIGEIRRISLSDGLSIILDTDSVMSVSSHADVRSLRLDRGRARLAVADGSRPLSRPLTKSPLPDSV